jgi:anti-sigma factor RsiW
MNSCKQTELVVVDYLDEALPPAERAAFEAHVASCDACRETLESYRAIEAAYRALPDADVGERLAGGLLHTAREATVSARAAPRRRSRTRTALLGLALLAASVLALVGLWRAFVAAPGDEPGRQFDALVVEGDARREAGDLAAARTAYEDALRLAGEEARAAEVLHRLAEVLVAADETERALEVLGEIDQRHPEYPERSALLLLEGEVLEALGESGRALQLYRRVAFEYPAQRDAARTRARELERMLDPHAGHASEGLGYIGYVE